jgi:flagellar hook-associated protein 2
MSVSVRGISSGVDINGIIEELMQLERQPIRRHEAQIERTEQIAELWREVNSRLDTLNRTLPPLQDVLTYTAPVPTSSDENVLTAKVSGMPIEGSYRINVGQLATYHSVATEPPTGQLISNASAALDLNGTFHLGVGRSVEGIDSLTFAAGTTGSWLRGNFGSGFTAVVDENPASVYSLNPDSLSFAAGYDGVDGAPEAEEIRVYLDSFVDAEGEDALAELQSYLTDKGWPEIAEDEPLFVIKKDLSDNWQTYNQADGTPFAFLGDHPLGTFNLRAEIVDVGDEVLAINDFDFQIATSIDETGFITIEEDDSLLDLADKINAMRTETGVIASVVQANADDYRLVLESMVEGGDGFIQAFDYTPLNVAGEAEYGTDSILATLSLLDGNENTAIPGYVLETEAALDAEFTLNGLAMSRSSNTLTNVISGLEITLTGEGLATLSVAPDIDAAIEEIDLFVQAVNEVNSYLRLLQEDEEGPLQGSSDLMRIERQLRTLIHGLVPDVPGSSHFSQPLTYAGSTGTASATATGVYTGSASQIQLMYYSATGEWRHNGVKFESGDTIDGVQITIGSAGTPSNLSTLTLRVSPPSEPLTYGSFASIGIMATDKEGFLAIDSTKLRAALAADPEGIFSLFAREAPVDSNGISRGPSGLVSQMATLVNNLIGRNGLVGSRQSFLDRQIAQYQERIEALEKRMVVREARLVRQFTFMEQYIARIQEQTGLMASFETMMSAQQSE